MPYGSARISGEIRLLFLFGRKGHDRHIVNNIFVKEILIELTVLLVEAKSHAVVALYLYVERLFEHVEIYRGARDYRHGYLDNLLVKEAVFEHEVYHLLRGNQLKYLCSCLGFHFSLLLSPQRFLSSLFCRSRSFQKAHRGI